MHNKFTTRPLGCGNPKFLEINLLQHGKEVNVLRSTQCKDLSRPLQAINRYSPFYQEYLDGYYDR
jgi:hypothetical protein